MKLLLDSGVIKYINILYIISLFFAFFSTLVGFVCFIFFIIAFSGIYLVSYLFRMENRLINNSRIISPTDGRVTAVSIVESLPDIITKHNNYRGTYNMIRVDSSFSTIYFKVAPIDGVVEDIQIFNPRTISKNSNFTHKPYRTYIIFKLTGEKIKKEGKGKKQNTDHGDENHGQGDNIFIINEVLFGDRNYNMYKLYVKIGDKVNKGDVLICNHFYSLLWIYLPLNKLCNIQKGQSLFYQETSLV